MLLYSGPLSLFSRKVEIALNEKGLPFERVMVPFTQAAGYAPKHPAVLAANPKGQVPVLVDGDLTLFDSTLIFEYLEDAYPFPALYPTGAAARARCRRLELTADEILLPPLVKLMYRTTPPDPDPERQRAFYAGLFHWQIGEGFIMEIPAGIGGPEPGPAGHIRGGDRSGVTLYVQVADLQASLDKSVTLGATVVAEPFDVPDGPTLAGITDPEGNPVMLVQA